MIATLFAVFFVLLFLLMDDFRLGATSLVKRYQGGSFQCVAYVQRYYSNAFDIEIRNVGRAQELYLKAPEYGLYAHRNGSVTAPQPGDILVFGHRNNVGHVAIVTGVIKEGVLIVEQNWGTSRITTNGGKPLPMKRENGTYTLEDRTGYYVIGWVSRTLNNPGALFDFSSDSHEGWIVESSTRKAQSNSDDAWAVAISGGNPTIVSPIFVEPIEVDKFEKVVVRARVLGGKDSTEGRLYLRDENDVWNKEISFEPAKSNTWTEFEIDLSSFKESSKVTQLKLKLSDPSNSPTEKWEIDWFRFIPVKTQQFPLD